jgi:SET domain-containing protein
MPKTKSPTRSRPTPPYRLRSSRIHGSGVFATRTIKKGVRIIEYTGERISHAEADRRHAHKAPNDNHTFLFTLDSKTVIDASVDGNVARFINHSCDPNCEAFTEDGRVFIESRRTIARGEELAYDYLIGREPNDPPDVEKIFACRCGAASCRGTMLAPRKTKKKKAASAKKAVRKKPEPRAKAKRRPKRG